MPFSNAVREEVLVKSHRRCCVCHEFAGGTANVHHIVQEANSGSNSIDNAICLCYNCHYQAGSYNSRHPLGIKYSVEELIKQRDQWWARCANKNVDVWSTQPSFGGAQGTIVRGTFDVAHEIRKSQAFLKKIGPLINSIYYSLRLHDSPVGISNELFNGIQMYRYFVEQSLGVNHPERLFNEEFSARRSNIYTAFRALAEIISRSNYAVAFDMHSGIYMAKYENNKFMLSQDDRIILGQIKVLMQSVINQVDEFSRAAY